MNLTNLRSFYTTVKNNSISKAAVELHLTQPGLSMQLQALENEIGVKLLNRSNKGVQLTKEGELVYEFSETMLSLENNLHKNLDKLKNKTSTLHISTCKSLGESIPCSIYTFKEIHFDIDISMDTDNSSNIIKKLLNHEINIGIIQGIEGINDSIAAIPMLKDKLLLVGAPNSNEDTITLKELLKLPLILRENGSASLTMLKAALKNKNINIKDLNVLISLNTPESIKSSIASGRGYSFLSEVSIAHELRNSTLKKILVEDLDITFDYNIIYRKNYAFNDHEQKFLNFLTSKKRYFCC